MLVPVLTTARLTLRGFCESDLGDYAALQADPEVMRHLGAGGRAGRTRTRDESWTDMALMLRQWALKGYGSFALEETASGRFVGRAGILHLPGWPEPELAFALVRSAWGQGFAEEACRAILPWAFSITGAERLVSSIKPGNLRSARLLARLGAVREGMGELKGEPCEVWVHEGLPRAVA